MFAINAVIEAIAGKEKELENALLGMIPYVQREEKTIIYTLHKDEKNPCKFLYYELYEDREAINTHISTLYFKQLMQKLDGLVKQKEVGIYEVVCGIRTKLDLF